MKPATSCDTAALTEHDPVSFDRTRPGPVAAEIPIVRTPSILRHLMPPPQAAPAPLALLLVECRLISGDAFLMFFFVL